MANINASKRTTHYAARLQPYETGMDGWALISEGASHDLNFFIFFFNSFLRVSPYLPNAKITICRVENTTATNERPL